MSTRKKRGIGGQVTIDGMVLNWSVRSEPQWNTTDGDIGMRLSVALHDEAKTRHGELKVWRELILEYPFENKQRAASRFPDRPKVDPESLVKDIRQAMEAGWNANSRGRPFTWVLD